MQTRCTELKLPFEFALPRLEIDLCGYCSGTSIAFMFTGAGPRGLFLLQSIVWTNENDDAARFSFRIITDHKRTKAKQ